VHSRWKLTGLGTTVRQRLSESLVAPLGGVGGLDFVLEESGFPRERIVLEITEE